MSSTTVPTVTSHWCRKVTSDKDDKTNDTCDVCISRSSRTRHSDQIAQREEHLGSRGSGLVSVMSIITPIHSSSIPFIHSIHSIHSIHHSGTIAQLHILSLYLLHEFHRTGTSSDSSRLYFLYKYTYIHAAAAIGSQPSVIVGGYWLSHRLSGSGWAGQYDNRTGRLSPLILLFSLRSLSCRSLSCQSLCDNQER